MPLAAAAAFIAAPAFSASGQVFQELYSFTGGADGGGPQGALIQGQDGRFYGTTGYGGKWTMGTVFRMTSAGVVTTIASFDGTNGDYPFGALLEASDGNLYGTTQYGGGSYNGGTVFKVTPAGALTRLGAFTGDAYALGGLVQGLDGMLYGVTQDGGDYNSYGAIFRTSTNGWQYGDIYINVHLFYGDDGLTPRAACCWQATETSTV
jgi:uncharacterized repeat protein (TIGR03803 family)